MRAGQRVDRLLHAAENVVAANQREQSKPREALLRPHGFEPRDRHVDAPVAQPADQLGEHRRAGVVDLDQRIRLDHDQLRRWVFGGEALDGATKIVGVEKRQRRLQRDQPERRERTRLSTFLSRGHQIDVPGMRSNSIASGARRRPDAMQHRQQDADGHPLLDRERHNCKRSREDQQKLGSASSPHVDHHADANKTYCDKEKDARQRGGGQMGERFAREQENTDRRRGRNQSRKLRPAARLRNGGRRRRACIHRKGADETTQGVGRSDADEIPVDVGAFRAVGERARRRRCLHHHHERDEHRERRDDVKVVPGDRQREMWSARQ